jgi:HPt (histidine-containing phosphotransfer) domain-containing protein
VAALSGINMERGLAAVLGKTEKYLEFLARLVAYHDEDMARVASHLSTGEGDDAQRLAHTLKGAAAMLGADALAAAAAHLEGLLKTHATGLDDAAVAKAIQRISEELAIVGAALNG